MGDLRKFQLEHKTWLEYNFPDQEPHEPLLGVTEEVGELAHAHLKKYQGIRINQDHHNNIQDAIGDIMIYLASYCNTNGYDLENCLKFAWQEVKERDWQKNKVDGSG